MRRYPGSWLSTYFKLGGPKSHRKKRQRAYRRDSRIERLEDRHLLTVDPLIVTTLDDVTDASDDWLSLREAVDLAQSNGPGHDTIRFDTSLYAAGPATVAVTQGQIRLDSDLTIEGPGSDLLTVSSGGLSRVLLVQSPAQVTLADFTVADGYVTNKTDGAGILSGGHLTLERMTLRDNQAGLASGGVGGAVYAIGGSIEVIDSTFHDNLANAGGALRLHMPGITSATISGSTFYDNKALSSGGALHIANSSSAELLIVNSTFSGNHASFFGGAIHVGGNQSTTLVNTTIVGNTVQSANRIAGISANGGGYYEIYNSIVADNLNNVVNGETAAGTLWNMGGALTAANNFINNNGTAAGLAPLADYGGPTLTHAILADASHLIDQGDASYLTPYSIDADQRGSGNSISPRIHNDIVDLGSVEYGTLPIGVEQPFQVTNHEEYNSQSENWVYSNERGATIVVWKGEGPEGVGVYVQHLNPESDVSSLPRLVDLGQEVAIADISSPRVAVDGQGRYVVVWRVNTGDEAGIWLRRYDAAGGAVDQFPVKVSEGTSFFTPSVEVNDAGRIVVIWRSGAWGPLLGQRDISFRRFTTSGLTLDSAPRVAASSSNLSLATSGRTVAVSPDGGFYVLWVQSGSRLMLQKFDSSGAKEGGPLVDEMLNSEDAFNPVALDIVATPEGGVRWAWRQTQQVEEFEGNGEEFTESINLVSRVQSQVISPVGAMGPATVVATGIQIDTEHMLYDGDDPWFWYYLNRELTVDRPTLAVDGEGRFGMAWGHTDRLSFDSEGYAIDEYGNPYWNYWTSENIVDQTTANLELAWFDAEGQKLASYSQESSEMDPYTYGAFTTDAAGNFLLTSESNEAIVAQRFTLPKGLTLSTSGLLAIDETLTQSVQITLSARLADGQWRVTHNGKLTSFLADNVKSIRILGGANDTRIDLSGVTATRFSGLSGVVDPESGTVPITVYGGAGDDTLTASSLGGTYHGEEGNDWLLGGVGKDRLYGGDGNDTLFGDKGDDYIDGEAGNDTLRGGTGIDILYGGIGDDELFGDQGDDQLFGNNGDDLLDPGSGTTQPGGVEFAAGGTGNDTYVVTDRSVNVGEMRTYEFVEEGGIDTLDFSSWEATSGVVIDLSASGPQLFDLEGTVGSTTDLAAFENVIGTSFGDTLTGHVGDNVLDAGLGIDTLDGGGGEDALRGGVGDDLYVVSPTGGAVVRIDDLAGDDTLELSGYGEIPVTFDATLVETSQSVGTDEIVLSGLGPIENVTIATGFASEPPALTGGDQFGETPQASAESISDFISGPGVQIEEGVYVIDEGDTLILTPQGVTTGPNVQFDLAPGSPAGMIINGSTGQLTWTPDETDEADSPLNLIVRVTTYGAVGTPPQRTSAPIQVLVRGGDSYSTFVPGSVQLKYEASTSNSYADATIVGQVYSEAVTAFVQVEFDYNYSGNPTEFVREDFTLVEFPEDSLRIGSFSFSPTLEALEPHLDTNGEISQAAVRIRNFYQDPSDPAAEFSVADIEIGEILTLASFKPSFVTNVAPSIELSLVNDSGAAGNVTLDPTLNGFVTNPDGPVDGLRVRFYDAPPTADSTPTGAVDTDENGNFTWTPTGIAPGEVEIHAWVEDRTSLEANPVQTVESSGSIAFQMGAIASPAITLFDKGGGLITGTATAANDHLALEDWSLQFVVAPTQPSDGAVAVDGVVNIGKDGTFQFVAPSLDLTPGGAEQTVWVRATARDEYTDTIVSGVDGSSGGWESVDVTPPALIAGDLEGTFEATGGGSPVQTPAFSGQVTVGGTPVSGAVVEFWSIVPPTDAVARESAVASFLGLVTTDDQGDYTFTPQVGWGESLSLWAQARYKDSGWQQLNSTSGQTGEATVTRASTPDATLLGSLGVVYNSGFDFAPMTRMPLIKGAVAFEGDMSGVVVEFDDGFGRVLGSVRPDKDGQFVFLIPDMPAETDAEGLSISVRARVTVPGATQLDLLPIGDGPGALPINWFTSDYNDETGQWNDENADASASAWLDEVLGVGGAGPAGAWYNAVSHEDWQAGLEDYATAWSSVFSFNYNTTLAWGVDASVAPSGESTNPTVSGTVSYAAGENPAGVDLTGMRLAFYLNGQSEPEGYATVTDDGGTYRYRYSPSGHQVGDNHLVIKALAPELANDETDIWITVLDEATAFTISAEPELTAADVGLLDPLNATEIMLAGTVPEVGALQTWIEFDYSVVGIPGVTLQLDGTPDGVVQTSGGGYFEFAPNALFESWGAATSATVSANYRVVVLREGANGEKPYKVYGDWASALTDRVVDRVETPSIQGYALANDTGPRAATTGAEILDRRTSDPTVEGWARGVRGDAVVELAYFNDAEALAYHAGFVGADSEGHFQFTPAGLENNERYDLRARVVASDPITDELLDGGWVAIEEGGLSTALKGFVVIEPEVAVVEDTDATTAGSQLAFANLPASGSTLKDPTVTGKIVTEDAAGGYALENVVVTFAWRLATGDQTLHEMPGYAVSDANGDFTFTPVGLPSNQDIVVVATPQQSERLPNTPSVPTIAETAVFKLQISQDLSFTNPSLVDLITLDGVFDVALNADISSPDPLVTPLYVEIDLGDRIVTSDIYTETTPGDGDQFVETFTFRYDIDLREEPIADQVNGKPIRFRIVGVGIEGLELSDWRENYNSTQFTLQAPAVPADFGLGDTPEAPDRAAIAALEGTASRLPMSVNDGVPLAGEMYVVEFDYDQDGFADAQELVEEFDSASEFAFAHELAGFPPGETTLKVRVIGYAGLSSGEELIAEGKWVDWQFTIENPAPTVASIAFESPEDAAPNESSKPTITGTISSALPEAELTSVYVEIDEDGDGEVDGTTAVELDIDGATWTYSYTLQDTQPRALELRVRAIDSESGVSELVGDWTDATGLTLIDPEPAAITSLELEDSTAGDEGPEATSPVLIGTVTFPSESTGRRVDFDHNGDGLVDGSAVVDAFGRFHYEPFGLAHGDQVIRARVVDQVGDRVRGEGVEDWPEPAAAPGNDPAGVFRFYHEAVEAPVLNTLSVVGAAAEVVGTVDSLVVDGDYAVVIEGRATVGGYGEVVTITIIATEVVDPQATPRVVEHTVDTNSSGYFRTELPELAGGVYTLTATPSVDDPNGDADVDGDPLTLTALLDFRPPAFPATPPSFSTGPALAYATGVDQTHDPTITGVVADVLPQTYVEFSDGIETTRVRVLDDGRFSFTPSGLVAGLYSYTATLVTWDPDSDSEWIGAPSTVAFDLSDGSIGAPPFEAFALTHDVSSVGELVQRSAEPLFEGKLGGASYVGRVGGLAIYFDHNGDGTDDGVAYTRADGTFTYRANSIEPGELVQTITARVRLTDYWGDSYTKQQTLDFELTRAPLIHEVAFNPSTGLIEGEVFYETAGAVEIETLRFGAGSTLGTPPASFAEFLASYSSPPPGPDVVDVSGEFAVAGTNATEGEVVVYLRAVHTDHPDYLNEQGQVDADHDGRLEGPWRMIRYDVSSTASAPDITGFTPAGDAGDPDLDGFLHLSDPTVTGSLGLGGAYGIVEVMVQQVDAAGLEIGEPLFYRTSANAAGDFSITPSALARGNYYEVSAHAIIYDAATGQEEQGATFTTPVRLLLIDSLAPTIINLMGGAVVDGPPGAVITGSVTRGDGGRVQALRVDLDIAIDENLDGTPEIDFDGESDGFAFTDADGEFRYVLYSLPTGAQASVKAIVRDWNAVTGEFIEGDFAEATASAYFEGNDPAEAGPELNESTGDEQQALVLATTEARKQLAVGLGSNVSTDGSGRHFVVTSMGEAQLLHLGGGGPDGQGHENIGVVLTINEGSTSGDGAWAVDAGTTQSGDLFFRQETNPWSFTSSPAGTVTTSELVGDDLVTTSITIANLQYDFSLAVLAEADGTLPNDELTITGGHHRVEESLYYDFWIEQTVTPAGQQDQATTTIYAGHYEVDYHDGVEGLTGVDAVITDAETLGGATPVQDYDYDETYTVNSWVVTAGASTEAPADGAQTVYEAGGGGAGTILGGQVSGETTETITVSDQRTITRETPEETKHFTSGDRETTETSYETYTESWSYDATLTLTTTLLEGGGEQVDFNLDELFNTTWTLVGGGSRNTVWTGGGDYDNSWWTYNSQGGGNYTGGASGTVTDRPEGDDSNTSVEATSFGNSSGSSTGDANAENSFYRSGDNGSFQSGGGSSRITYQSTGSSNGTAGISGVNDDVTSNGDSGFTSGGLSTINAESTVKFATPLVAEIGGQQTSGTTTSRAIATTSGDGSGSLQFDRGLQGATVNGDSSSTGTHSGSVGSESRGIIKRFGPPSVAGGTLPTYSNPFRTNTVTTTGGDATVNVGIQPIGSQSELSDPNTTLLYSGDIEGGKRTVTFTTTYVGLQDQNIDEGDQITLTFRSRDETEDFADGNQEGEPTASGKFKDHLIANQLTITNAKSSETGVALSGGGWVKDVEAFDIAFAEIDQTVDGRFEQHEPDGSGAPTRTSFGNLKQTEKISSAGSTTTNFIEWQLDAPTENGSFVNSFGKHDETVTRSGSSSSNTTGYVSLANDAVIESLTDTDFGMTSTVRILQQGTGTTHRQSTNAGDAVSPSSKTVASSSWNYETTSTGHTEVPDMSGNVNKYTNALGSITKTTVKDAETSGNYSTKSTTTGTLTVESVEDGLGGYQNHAETTYTTRENGSGDHTGTSSGWTLSSRIAGGAFSPGSSHDITSTVHGFTEIDTTWDTTEKTPGKTTITNGHSKPSLDSTRRLTDGKQQTALGVSHTTGTLRVDTIDKSFLDTDVTVTHHNLPAGSTHTAFTTADVDTTVTTKVTGALSSSTFGETFVPDSDPTVTGQGSYAVVHLDKKYRQEGTPGQVGGVTEWTDTTTWNRGGYDRPQAEGNSKHYERHEITHSDADGDDRHDIVNHDKTEVVTTKQGERGLQAVTTVTKDHSDVTVTHVTVTEEIKHSKTVTKTLDQDTTTTFTSAGQEEGDKQKLHTKHDLTKTVSEKKEISYEESYWPFEFDANVSFKEVPNFLTTQETADVTIEDDFYEASHNLGSAGTYTARTTRTTSKIKTGSTSDAKRTVKVSAESEPDLFSKIAVNASLNHSTSSVQTVNENGSYDSPSATPYNVSIQKTSTDIKKADPESNYVQYDSAEEGMIAPFTNDSTAYEHRVYNNYKWTFLVDKEVTTETNSAGKVTETGRDNYATVDTRDSKTESPSSLYYYQVTTSTVGQELQIRRDGSKTGVSRDRNVVGETTYELTEWNPRDENAPPPTAGWVTDNSQPIHVDAPATQANSPNTTVTNNATAPQQTRQGGSQQAGNPETIEASAHLQEGLALAGQFNSTVDRLAEVEQQISRIQQLLERGYTGNGRNRRSIDRDAVTQRLLAFQSVRIGLGYELRGLANRLHTEHANTLVPFDSYWTSRETLESVPGSGKVGPAALLSRALFDSVPHPGPTGLQSTGDEFAIATGVTSVRLLARALFVRPVVAAASAADDLANTPLAQQLANIADDALVNFGGSARGVVNPGAGGRLYAFRYGDIKHLTPNQIETLIGGLAEGGKSGGAQYIRILGTSIDDALTQPGPVGFTEYFLRNPSATINSLPIR